MKDTKEKIEGGLRCSPLKATALTCAIATVAWVTMLICFRSTEADRVLMDPQSYPSGSYTIVAAYESDATKAAGLDSQDTIATLSKDGEDYIVTYSIGDATMGISHTKKGDLGFFFASETELCNLTDGFEGTELYLIKEEMEGWLDPVDKKGAAFVGESDDGLREAAFSRKSGQNGFAYVDPETSKVARAEIFGKYTDADGNKRTEHYMAVFSDEANVDIFSDEAYADAKDTSKDEFSVKTLAFLSGAMSYAAQEKAAEAAAQDENQSEEQSEGTQE